MKRSPFFQEIAAFNPEFVNIQGWEVPNVFTSSEAEHTAVRERVGLLDWSTTGEFEIKGPDALAVVQKLIVNDASKMPINRVLYTSILNEDGGMKSDITVYRLGEEHYMLMTAWGSNAADERPEYDLLVEHAQGKNAYVFDGSPGYGLLAVQGPQAKNLLKKITDADLDNLKYMWCMPAEIAGVRSIISRTGYTGELGYEILIPIEYRHDFWSAIMDAGAAYDIAPVGMVAAFSLRIEKGYIMRFDFAGGRTPYEIGLGWTVKPDKGDFIGREALLARKAAGFKDTLVAIALEDGYVPPPGGEAILHEGEQIGLTTSGAFGYTVGKAITLGYVPLGLANVGTGVTVVDKDGGEHQGEIGPRAMYDPERTRLGL